MGLSKKLGGVTQRVTLPVSSAVPYKWSHQTYTVEEILNKFKLPCVVQCATDTCTVLWSDFQFDLRQPLLFYSRRSAQKVHAVCLKQEKAGLEELGPPLAIPEDYEGWFGATPKGNNKVKRHLRIEGVANSTARRFVVTTKCPAFTSCRGPDGDLQYVPHDVMPGEVLKRVCIMDSDGDDPHSPSLVKEHGPCLECLDDKDEDVIIPLSHRAVTYEIAEMYPDDEERVFQIASVIKAGNSKLPRVLTLVQGEPPQLAYTFTSMIRCYSVFTEETILAATLDDPSSRCLEMATDSCARFRLSLNEAAVKKTCEYNNAFQICETFGSKFVTGIKVSFSLKPETSELDDIDMSFYESVAGSELQEIEANSEFEIAWGSVKKARLLMESNSVGEDSDSSTAEDTKPVPMVSLKEGSEIQDVSSKLKNLDKTVSDSSDTSLPKHRDFTEQEIKDLMLRKGLMAQTESSGNESQELESLKENRVTDNPLFYFFQRNPDQNPWKTPEPEEEERSTAGDSPAPEDCEGDTVKNENPLSYLFEKPPDHTPGKPERKKPLDHLFQQSSDPVPVDVTSDSDVSSATYVAYNTDIVDPLSLAEPTSAVMEFDLEFSQFDRTVCKVAKEYNADDDVDGDDDVISDNDVSPTDAENETEVTYPVSLAQPVSADLNPDLQISQYDHAVCKTAKEYSSDDDDNDDDSDDDDDVDDDDIESDADDSNPSEDERIPDAMQKLAFHQDVIMPPEEKDVSADDDILFPDLPPEVESDDPFAANKCTFSTFLGSGTKKVENTPLEEYNDESQAVDDLLSLAEMESTKVSSLGLSENEDQTEVKRSLEGHFGNRTSKPKTDNAADRLKSLLEEVSSLVNTSSGRILHVKKASHFQEDKTEPSSMTKLKDHSQIPRSPIANNSKKFPAVSKTFPDTRGAFAPAHPDEAVSVPDEDCVSSIKHPDLKLDSSKTGNHDIRSLPRGRTSKVDSAINFYSGLDSKKSKSEDFTGALRRSRVEVNLAHIGQTSDKRQTTKDLFEPFHSESTISSIFRVEKDEQNRFQSSKVKLHPHEHPHSQRQSSDREDVEHDIQRDRTISFDDAENDSSIRRSQRESSLNRGKVLASVQNFERLSSTNSSFSSNRSSSIGSSFRQSSPKLVLISDVGLTMSGNSMSQQTKVVTRCYHYSDQRATSPDPQSHNYDDNVDGESEEEVFAVEDQCMISRSGKFKPNRINRSYRPTVLHQMDGYVEREDFV